ncbi:MAG: hypothetical protein ACXVZV_01160 [Terriglobales bacterium]
MQLGTICARTIEETNRFGSAGHVHVLRRQQHAKEIAEGKRYAKPLGALDLLACGEVLEQLGPLLNKLSANKSRKKRFQGC